MIPPLPPNFGFALIAVPTWRWEETPVPPPAEETPCETPGADAGGDTPAAASTSPQGRYVFLGYEWKSQVQWSLFPDAPWENAFGVQAEELHQAALRSERDRQQAQHVAPRPAAHTPDPDAEAPAVNEAAEQPHEQHYDMSDDPTEG